MTKKITLILAFLLSVGCASGLKPVEFAADTDPNAEISKLEQDVQSARSQQTDMASPKYFRMADKNLAAAKKSREKGESPKEILKEVGLGRAALNEATRIQEITRQQFTDVSMARDAAIAAGARESHPRMLNSIDADFEDVTKDFESQAVRGKTAATFSQLSQDKRESLKRDYAKLEFEALKTKHLGRAKALIDSAEKNKASTYAPKTLNSAKTKYRDAEMVLSNNRTDESAIRAAVTEADQEAEKLVRVTETARTARGLSSEEIALDIESKKEAISEAETASEESAQAIAEKNEQLAGVMNENQEYRRRVEFDQALAQAQKMFKPEEADVYRQGDKILIRLKSANFVSGRAEVGQNAYPVLGKVKDLISEVGAEDIVVEGHTDITGSKAANMKLSKERAESVAAYLKNNTDISEELIKTEGFGFDKPLAPNNTKKGRAQNRRVDIIVTPSVVR